MIRGQRNFRWYGRWVNDYHGADAAFRFGIDPKDYGRCDHVIRIPGDNEAYEIGVIDNHDGTFRLAYDHYGPGQKLVKLLGGQDLPKLTQEYIKIRATETLVNQGFTQLNEEILADGTVKLTLEGPPAL